jgi:hypothetical protein
MFRSCDSGTCTITWVPAPALSGTIQARVSSSQGSWRASWHRCAWVRWSSLHAWGGWGMAPTSTGTATTYYEDYLYNSQIIAPNQVLSLVAEGVFDRHPDLRVCLAELGFAWLPSLLWRFGKDWKALENLLGLLTEDDREAVLSKNAAAFFDLQVPAVS